MALAGVASIPSPPLLPPSLSDGDTSEETGRTAAVPATGSAAEQEELNVPVPEKPFDALPPPVPSLKRAHSPPISPPTVPYTPAAFKDEWPSDDESHEAVPPAAKKARTIFGVVGISASAVAGKEAKLAMVDGSLEIDPVNLERYKEKCRAVDSLAEFREGEKWQVFHSVCAKWYTMTEAYHVRRFKDHVATCPTRLKQLALARKRDRDGRTSRKKPATVMRTSTLDQWGPQLGWVKQEKPRAAEVVDTGEAAKGGQAGEVVLKTVEVAAEAAKKLKAAATVTPATVPPVPPPPVKKITSRATATSKVQTTSSQLSCKSTPCPGITASHEPHVPAYLGRTGALGGGAPSVTTVARDLFSNKHTVYSKLSPIDKEKVDTEQKHRWAWRNDHGLQAVFSTTCRKSTSNAGGPCLACSQVLRLKPFRNALKVRVPDKDDYRYLNDKYKNSALGAIYTKAHGISGLIQDQVRSLISLQFLSV